MVARYTVFAIAGKHRQQWPSHLPAPFVLAPQHCRSGAPLFFCSYLINANHQFNFGEQL